MTPADFTRQIVFMPGRGGLCASITRDTPHGPAEFRTIVATPRGMTDEEARATATRRLWSLVSGVHGEPTAGTGAVRRVFGRVHAPAIQHAAPTNPQPVAVYPGGVPVAFGPVATPGMPSQTTTYLAPGQVPYVPAAPAAYDQQPAMTQDEANAFFADDSDSGLEGGG